MEFKLPKREQNSHKGTFGKVLNIAGSKYMPGAAYLSSVSALKIGCGYCFLASDEDTIKSVAAQTQNIVFLPLEEIISREPDVISIGCGLTTGNKAQEIFIDTIKNFQDIPIVIDADGLNILSQNKDIRLPKNTIITPHHMEAARLLDETVENISSSPKDYGIKLSQRYNCITVLKGHNTVVTDPNGNIYTNKTGNSALAKAGSGDVLTGMISGLIAQKMNLFEAAKLGVYLHGLAGELASKDLTEYSVMAKDIIEYIPDAIKTFGVNK